LNYVLFTFVHLYSYRCNSQCNIYFDSKFDWVTSINTPTQRIGRLKGLDLDKIAYVLQACENAFVIAKDCNIEMKMLQENFHHCEKELYIAVEETDLMKILHPRNKILLNVPVGFRIKQHFFNGLIKAVQRINKEIIHQILPMSNDFLPTQEFPLPCKPESLDESQYDALKRILASNPKSPPILINGSFGSGKTRLLAAISCALLEQKTSNLKILICAHHHSTLDVLMKEYFVPELEKQHLSFELVRLISISYKVGKFPKYSKYFKYSRDIDKIKLNPMAVIVLTTFSTSLSMVRSIGNEYFTHIFLDEGAQVREPDAIGPLCLASTSTKVVIAGDKCQVSANLHKK